MKKNKFVFASVFALLAAALCLSSCKDEKNNDACPQHKDADSCCQSPAATPAAPASNEKLLSHHDTQAVFKGTRQHRCRGMTMLCPDKCGDSGTLALFDIKAYNDYQQPDKYGDPKADQYVFMLASTTGTSDVSPETAELVKSLQVGDEVNLVWDHVYVSDDHGSYPKRVVRKIEKR